MSNKPAFILGADAITVIVGSKPYVLTKGNLKHAELVEAITAADWDRVCDIVTESDRMADALQQFGDVKVFHGHVTYKGEPLHGYVADRMVECARAGIPIDPIASFLQKVQDNPSYRARQDLFEWLDRGRLGIFPDGDIRGLKIVRDDYTDVRTGTFDNSVGKVVEIPREAVDDDFTKTCSTGLHFCSTEYLPAFGPSNKRVVVVKVNPRDVVAFPRDYDMSKARCCRYEVVEEIPAETAATYFEGRNFVDEDYGDHW